MKKLVLVPLAVLFVIAGCQDLRKDYQVPVEAQVGTPMLSTGGGPEGPAGPSTVCVAYGSELERAQTDGDLEKIANLEIIIEDACN